MNARKRPVSILALACLYAITGIFGFARNLHAFGQPDFIWIELIEVFALIAWLLLRPEARQYFRVG